HWYMQAEPRLQGLEHAQVDKRLQEIDQKLPLDLVARTGGPSLTAQSAALPPGPEPPQQFVGLLGRVRVQGADARIRIRYQNGMGLTDRTISDLFRQMGVPRLAVQIELSGLLHVAEPM